MNKGSSTKNLSFKEFMEYVKDEISRVKGIGYEVKINHIIKNNSIELEGLVILKSGDTLSPNIYLNDYYEQYIEGINLESIIEKIIVIHENSKYNDLAQNTNYYDFELMKSFIIYRIINNDKNKELLKTIPYISFLDLAITFHCLIQSNGEGIGTIRITHDLLMHWNTSIEVVTELARINTPRLFPPLIRSMEDVINDILNNDNNYLNSNETDVTLEAEIMPIKQEELQSNMYVLSNVKGINGASCLLYPEIIKKFANQRNSDFYILPSSIHELILIPIRNTMKLSDLAAMVSDVNDTQVATEDVLSNHVYIYRRKDDAISLQH